MCLFPRRPMLHRQSLLLVVLPFLLSACSPIRSSSVRTGTAVAAYQGVVQVRALGVPDAPELGLVQVSGPVGIDELMPEFSKRVAELGGNLGLLDSVKSAFEMVSQMESYSYSCGDSKTPRTCTGTRYVTREVMTVQLLGRAFRM